MVPVGGPAVGEPAVRSGCLDRRATPADRSSPTNKSAPVGHFEGLIWRKGVTLGWPAISPWVSRAGREPIDPRRGVGRAWQCRAGKS